MTSALVSSSHGPDAPTVGEDLKAVGIQVLDVADHANLVHQVIRTAPDLVILYEKTPDAALFGSIEAINAAAPRPVIVFTTDPDAEKIALAARSGVNAYVVNGYGRHRLRSVIHLAQARFRHDQLIRDELAEVNRRFAERKLVDRAKGILMGARRLREEEAYRALRSAAMHTKQRIGQVSQMVIDAAGYAEAINRAGQLRMLSQRLVKLYAQACAGLCPDETRGLSADALGQVEDNLAILARILSRATFGDLLDAVLLPWKLLRTALGASALVGRLQEVDRLAEAMLMQAEQLTANLEIAGLAAALHVINVSGRQRMLCQRLAKQALSAALLGDEAAAAGRPELENTRAELVEGFAYLGALPLSNADIARELDQATRAWQALETALADPDGVASRQVIAESSEVMLAHFDRLTDHLERGMQALVR